MLGYPRTVQETLIIVGLVAMTLAFLAVVVVVVRRGLGRADAAAEEDAADEARRAAEEAERAATEERERQARQIAAWMPTDAALATTGPPPSTRRPSNPIVVPSTPLTAGAHPTQSADPVVVPGFRRVAASPAPNEQPAVADAVRVHSADADGERRAAGSSRLAEDPDASGVREGSAAFDVRPADTVAARTDPVEAAAPEVGASAAPVADDVADASAEPLDEPVPVTAPRPIVQVDPAGSVAAGQRESQGDRAGEPDAAEDADRAEAGGDQLPAPIADEMLDHETAARPFAPAAADAPARNEAAAPEPGAPETAVPEAAARETAVSYDGVPAEVRALAARGDRIGAIELLRRDAGLGLWDAKAIVDRL